MSTMTGYTVEQETDKTGEVLQSLLLLGRKFLGQLDSGIQRRHAWDASQFMPNIPSRVWRRHSALLTLLIHHTEAMETRDVSQMSD